MVRGFGKLHHTVVRRYIQAILYGLITLHEAGIVYGGVSESSNVSHEKNYLIEEHVLLSLAFNIFHFYL
jgi:hypothetical protein